MRLGAVVVSIALASPTPTPPTTPAPPTTPTTPTLPSPTVTPLLGSSSPQAPPAFAYQITCSDGHTFQGTLQGAGGLRYGPLPPGTTCTVTPTAAAGLPDTAAQTSTPVPAGGQTTVSYQESQPALTLSPAVGVPGRATTVLGAGFPPGLPVSLSWSDGVGDPVLATAAADGTFQASVLVLPGAPTGTESLVATGIGLLPVSADYLVQPNSVEAESASARVAFRP